MTTRSVAKVKPTADHARGLLHSARKLIAKMKSFLHMIYSIKWWPATLGCDLLNEEAKKMPTYFDCCLTRKDRLELGREDH